jgi:hypothetical protein
MSLYTSSLKDCFDCRNNASKKNNHQVISKSTEAKGTKVRRRFLPSGRKIVRIFSKARTSHQDIYQKYFHSTFDLWRHRGKHRDQGVTPALGKTVQEYQPGRILRIYLAQHDPDMRKLDDEVFLNI